MEWRKKFSHLLPGLENKSRRSDSPLPADDVSCDPMPDLLWEEEGFDALVLRHQVALGDLGNLRQRVEELEMDNQDLMQVLSYVRFKTVSIKEVRRLNKEKEELRSLVVTCFSEFDKVLQHVQEIHGNCMLVDELRKENKDLREQRDNMMQCMRRFQHEQPDQWAIAVSNNKLKFHMRQQQTLQTEKVNCFALVEKELVYVRLCLASQTLIRRVSPSRIIWKCNWWPGRRRPTTTRSCAKACRPTWMRCPSSCCVRQALLLKGHSWLPPRDLTTPRLRRSGRASALVWIK